MVERLTDPAAWLPAGLEQFLPTGQLGYPSEALGGTSVDPPVPEKAKSEVFITFEPYLPHGERICLPCG